MSSPLLFVIACLIWGSTFWAITLQLGEVAPAVSVAYRFGLASAALFDLGVYLTVVGSTQLVLTRLGKLSLVPAASKEIH